MKISKFCAYLLPFAMVGLASSCNNDDDSMSVTPEKMAAIGSYTLTAINITPETDVNGDGNTTENVLSELPCATGTLVLNEDDTYSWNFVGVRVFFITGDLYNFSCTSMLSSQGIWEAKNDLLTLSDGANIVLFSVDGDRITNTIGEDLPNFNTLVYTKDP